MIRRQQRFGGSSLASKDRLAMSGRRETRVQQVRQGQKAMQARSEQPAQPVSPGLQAQQVKLAQQALVDRQARKATLALQAAREPQD
jgi:hypothetical protein